MLDRASLTERYLDEITRRGLQAGELLGDLPDTELLNAAQPPGRKYLSRPLFLGQVEREQLYHDVETLHAAVVSLPQRRFGGDFATFARAAGAGDTYIAAVLREQGSPWRELGLDAHACHVGQLQVRGGRVWLDGRPVDIIAWMFMIEYLTEAP